MNPVPLEVKNVEKHYKSIGLNEKRPFALPFLANFGPGKKLANYLSEVE